MDSQSIDELVTLRARVRELEASIAAHFSKVHGPESITACEAVTRLGEYAAKLQEAEKERDELRQFRKTHDACHAKWDSLPSQQAEALRAAREMARELLYSFTRKLSIGSIDNERQGQITSKRWDELNEALKKD